MDQSVRPSPGRVVLVDDDEALLASTRFLLELDGYDVETLASTEALLAYRLPKHGACLVLDQNFEGLSGLDALALLRARGMMLPTLLITTHAPERMRKRAAELGAVVVLKPLLGDALAFEISRALHPV